MMKTFMFFGMSSDFGFHWMLLLLFIPLIHRLWLDWYTIEKRKKEVNHVVHTLVTAGLMLLLSWWIWKVGPARYLFQPFFLGSCLFLFLFDYLLNLIRGKKWYYIDEGKDGKTSKIDGLWLASGILGELFIKLFFIFLGFSVYFYLSYAL